MKWLRECFAEYARHPLPTFIGVAIIGASLVTAAMAFITRHPASEPSARWRAARRAQRQLHPPPAPRGRHDRRNARHRPRHRCQRRSQRPQPSRSGQRYAGTRGLRTVCTLNHSNATWPRTLMAGTIIATAPGIEEQINDTTRVTIKLEDDGDLYLRPRSYPGKTMIRESEGVREKRPAYRQIGLIAEALGQCS